MKKKVLRLSVLALAVAAVAAGCGGSKTSVPTGAVAKVGTEAITKAEFDRLLAQAERSYKSQNREFPKAGSPEYRTLQNQAMQFLVQRSEFAQKAEEMGVRVTDKQVEGRLSQIKKQYFGGSDKRYKQQLTQQGLTDEQVREDIRAQLINEEIFRKVTGRVKVTEEELRRYYETHPEQYSQPASRDVRHILVKNKATADKVYAQLQDGANFAALARKHTQDPGTKTLGGRLTVSRGQTVPPFDKVAFSLKPNELSEPVKTQYGWHVIQALSLVRPSKKTPFAQVKEAIRQQLLQQKRSEAMAKWVEDLRKEFEGEIAYATGYAPPSTETTQTQTVQQTGR